VAKYQAGDRGSGGKALMAYIDPEGMFGGDRMALLSDSAKMAWPWFWCASNTVGRVELNYREFTTGAFRQFRKHPTEKQFWEWVEEFHEAFLLFVYQANGQAWGQWDVTERYLPKYKVKADERTPAPVAADFLKWRGAYQNSKIQALSAKCRLFSVSENFQKLSESSETFPVGSGSGYGSGVGEEQEQRAPKTGALAVVPPRPSRTKKRTTEELLKALGPERTPWWEGFWSVYPCHEGMRDGLDTYERLVHTRDLAVQIYKGAEAYREQIEQRRISDPAAPVKYAQGWLNAERWKDEIRTRDPTAPLRANQELQDAWSRA
jgi:hypothetical protein